MRIKFTLCHGISSGMLKMIGRNAYSSTLFAATMASQRRVHAMLFVYACHPSKKSNKLGHAHLLHTLYQMAHFCN
jgi:hypothetical protein